jgi:hypothetical protein
MHDILSRYGRGIGGIYTFQIAGMKTTPWYPEFLNELIDLGRVTLAGRELPRGYRGPSAKRFSSALIDLTID